MIKTSPRFWAAFASQAIRATAGIAMLIAIGSLASPQEVSGWYVLQGAVGWVLLADCGFSAFLGSRVAVYSARGVSLESACRDLLRFTAIASAAIAASSWALLYCTTNLPQLAILLTMFGAIAAVLATAMQSIVQARGLVAESLGVNAVAQACIAAGAFLGSGKSLATLCVVWASGNILWLTALSALYTHAVKRDALGAISTASALTIARRHTPELLAFASGQLAALITGRLVLTLNALSFSEQQYACLSYTLNVAQSLVSVLGFPINGTVVDVLRSIELPSARTILDRFRKNALFTAACAAAVAYSARPFLLAVHLADDALLAGPGLFGLVVLIVAIEALGTWLRPVGQSGGRLRGVACCICSQLIAGALAAYYHSTVIYLTARLCGAIVTAATDNSMAAQVAPRARSTATGPGSETQQ